jgi:hypothetical protein
MENSGDLKHRSPMCGKDERRAVKHWAQFLGAAEVAQARLSVLFGSQARDGAMAVSG